MSAIVMDGKMLAEEVKKHVREEVTSLKKHGVTPCLATILAGDDPASMTYLRIKHRSCAEVGISSRNYQLPKNIEEEKLLGLIGELNGDEEVHGILVQLPIPPGIDGYKVIESISAEKDVDGLHPYNAGRISYKKCDLVPCTPKGIMAMLARYKIGIEGKHAVIINRSNLVGKPLYTLLSSVNPLQMLFLNTDILLLNADATVTICHSKTRDLDSYTRNADILISAVGRRPDFEVTGDMVKPGSAVIDVGVTKIDGKLYGDLDFKTVSEKASHVTPVPGGVGPMTVAMLLHNTLIATGKQTSHEIKYNLNELWR